MIVALVSREREAHRGLAMVELLIAMGLGAFLSAVMANAFLASQRSALYDEQMARIQENARYALRLLTSELAAAGFYGGALNMDQVGVPAVAADCGETAWALDSRYPLQWVNDVGSEGAPVTVDGSALECVDVDTLVENSDLLAIKRTASAASLRNGIEAPGLTRSTGQVWYLQMREGQAEEWIRQRPLDLRNLAAPGAPVSYWEAISRIYFLRNYSQDHDDDIPSLCMETLAGNAMTARCLVEGVENLQLEFGLDMTGDGVANRFTDAPSVSEQDRVVSAKIHLLLRSVAGISSHRDTKSYLLGSKVVAAANDNHIRRVYSATVILGNRVKAHG